MTHYFTTGQVARRLRISVSTLKRWLSQPDIGIADRRNHSSWRLFSEGDFQALRNYKHELRRNGRRFNDTTLLPIVVDGARREETQQLGVSVG